MWSNYWDILASATGVLLGNSLIIATLTRLARAGHGVDGGLHFAHLRFFGSRMLSNYFLLGLMFPAATAILPIFIRIRDLGLLDTYFGVVLPQAAFGLGMSVPLIRNYFKDLPTELFDAAFVDGCGYSPISGTSPCRWRDRSWRPSAPSPSCRAGTATCCRSSCSTPTTYPWPLGIMVYQGEYSSDWQLVLAFITLTILPTIMLFLRRRSTSSPASRRAP